MTDLGYRIAALLSRRLPRPVTGALADLCADLYVAAHPMRARAVRRNLLRAGARTANPRLTYRAFARAVRDFLDADRAGSPEQVVLDNEAWGSLAAARAAAEPTLLVSGHFGPWERALGWIAPQVGGVEALAAPHRMPAVERFFEERRAVAGVRTLGCDRPVRAALTRLREGGWIAALVDRAAAAPTAGGLVPIDHGPLLLARRARALVLAGVSWMEADGTLQVRFDTPFSLEPRRGGLALPQALARLQQFFDAHVRAHPTQWFEWRAEEPGGAGAAA
jgi:lauroyl/myristoyl acyltransferase